MNLVGFFSHTLAHMSYLDIQSNPIFLFTRSNEHDLTNMVDQCNGLQKVKVTKVFVADLV